VNCESKNDIPTASRVLTLVIIRAVKENVNCKYLFDNAFTLLQYESATAPTPIHSKNVTSS
jgi:hypothetical protein